MELEDQDFQSLQKKVYFYFYIASTLTRVHRRTISGKKNNNKIKKTCIDAIIQEKNGADPRATFGTYIQVEAAAIF